MLQAYLIFVCSWVYVLFVILPRKGQREAENMKNRRNEDDRGRDRERRRALMNDDEGKRNRERNRLRQIRTQCKALKKENQKQ